MNDEPTAHSALTCAGFVLSQEPVLAAPAEALPMGALADLQAPAFEDLGELPESYGEDSLFLMARDPHWLFSYWDFEWMKVPPVNGEAPVFHLRVLKSDGTEDASVEIQPEARNWYVPVNGANTEYYAELGYFDSVGAWQSCVRSRATRTPPSGPAGADLPTNFGTAPEALTFEQLIAVVREQRTPGESGVNALGRLTNELRTQSGGGVIDETIREQVLAALNNEVIPAAVEWGRELAAAGVTSWPAALFAAESNSSPSWPPDVFASQETFGPSWPPDLFATDEASAPSWPPQVTATLQGGALNPLVVEVVLHAGVPRDSRVTINGRPVGARQDGSFRLQLEFSQREWTIPIVVRSADGRNLRSGTLSSSHGEGISAGSAEFVQPLPQWTGFA